MDEQRAYDEYKKYVDEILIQASEKNERDCAEKAIRHAIKHADGLTDQQIASRTAFDWEHEEQTRHNKEKE